MMQAPSAPHVDAVDGSTAEVTVRFSIEGVRDLAHGIRVPEGRRLRRGVIDRFRAAGN